MIAKDFAETCSRMLSETGRLSRAIPGFVVRDAQAEMAKAVAKAIEQSGILVAEAGTGTGKTFAYLLPCLLSEKKAIISTATKTLQDQLFQKDLPMLINALGLSVRVQNLKGRGNYICRYRTELFAEEGSFQTPKIASEILYVRSKLGQLQQGERGELPEIKEDSGVWPYVTSTTENCQGNECAYYQDCFLVKARRRAMSAQVVVINHHLFFADTRLKETGFGELLPGVDVIVFDEAHQLHDIAVNFYGERLSTRQIKELMEDAEKEWPVLDLANQPLKALILELEKITEAFLFAFPFAEERISWQDGLRKPKIKETWEQLGVLLGKFEDCFSDELFEQAKGLKRCQERLEEMLEFIKAYQSETTRAIFWMERFKQTIVFHLTPFDVAQSFSELIQQQKSAFILTSATLTIDNSFRCFTKPLGIEEAQTLLLSSPFDYKKQALLYLPRSLPDPKDERYYEALLVRVIPVIESCGGRCFFLFTSHKALNKVAQMLKNHIKYPLLIQGEEAKPILLARFRELGNAVLLGTATFWEGVDVKGEALSCVIIDKLPFSSPNDPVTRAKMSYLKTQGLSGFDEMTLPEAVIALKQGVGRLIRDAEDKGVLVIADPRLSARNYGETIVKSLPPLSITRDEKNVLKFIEELALTHETVSD